MDTRDFDQDNKKGTMSVRFREQGGVSIADVAGEIRLTEDSTPCLRRLIEERLASGASRFLLNFARVEFIDSYGVGDIVAAALAVREKKGALKMANLSPKIWLIFNYSGLTRTLEIFDSEEKALASFG